MSNKFKVMMLSVVLAIGASACSFAFHYRGLLPEKIGVSRHVLTDDVFRVREGCGVAIFELSESTLNQIKEQGLSFFEGATRARSYDPDKDRYNGLKSYEECRETSMLEEDSPYHKFWIGLSCASNLDESLHKAIFSAVSTQGSYYTGNYEAGLVVIPKMRLVILSYEG